MHWLQSEVVDECWAASTLRDALLVSKVSFLVCFELFNSVNRGRLLTQLDVKSGILLVDLLEFFPLIDSSG